VSSYACTPRYIAPTYTCGLTSLFTDCEHRVEPRSPAGSGVRTDPSSAATAACAKPSCWRGGDGAVVLAVAVTDDGLLPLFIG
jgi:hypothetical protein